MSWIESSEASSLYGLDVDQSHYNVSSRYGEPVYLYSLSSECVKCPFTRLQQINTHASLTIKSAVDYSFRVFDQDQGIYSNATSDNYLCELNRTSGEFGAYHLLIHADGRCAVDTVYEPVNIYFRKPTLITSFCFPPSVTQLIPYRRALYTQPCSCSCSFSSAWSAPSRDGMWPRPGTGADGREQPPPPLPRPATDRIPTMKWRPL